MTDREFDVLVIGELNADLILRGDVTPAFGQVEQIIDDATLTIGSSSAIFACGAARLGLRVAFIGKAGDDEFGRFMLRELDQRHVDTQAIVIDPHIPTGLSVILSRPSDRAILTHLGSIAALRFDEIDLTLLSRARHLHLGSYFLLDTLRPDVPRLFDEAKARGLSISMDTNYDPTAQWTGGLRETLQRVDVFLPNETELLAITQEDSIEAGLDRVAEIPTVAVKLGARGAMARRGSQIVHAASLPVKVVDTTGAGDSFDAGFVYAYLAGQDLAQALRFACVCGSLSTRAAGGTAAQATRDEVLAALRDV
ncbi:MAG: carbohydrate kinase family protein [Chloroflexi bacterium]|nr:carbohydrate kinase family protein [Chloroflexota bacterium]